MTLAQDGAAEPARRIWFYEDMDSWRADVLELLRPQVTPRVIAAFRKKPPEYVVSDDLTWLNSIIYRVEGDDCDTKTELAMRLPERFDCIRAYHGARPVDVASYYTDGIRIMDPYEAEQRARDVFLSGKFPELNADDVARAIEKVPRYLEEGRAYFEASRRELEKFCGHYMLYGSEFVTGVAAGLRGPRDYRQALKEIGTPTVFTCDVPLSMLTFSCLKDFAGTTIASIFEQILEPQYRHPPAGQGSCLTIRQTLPPEFIVGHHTPEALRDPLTRQYVRCS